VQSKQHSKEKEELLKEKEELLKQHSKEKEKLLILRSKIF